MALVVFLRGVNVGGHRIFRPSILAKKLERYDVVSIGAAGTFVVRKPSTRFRAEFSRHLPFETHIVFCDGGDLLRLQNPFGRSRADVVPFVSVLSEARPVRAITLPGTGKWLVRVIGSKGQFVSECIGAT